MVKTIVTKDQFLDMWTIGMNSAHIRNRNHVPSSAKSVGIVYDYLMIQPENVVVSPESIVVIMRGFFEHTTQSFWAHEAYIKYMLKTHGLSHYEGDHRAHPQLTVFILAHPKCVGFHVCNAGEISFVFRV